MKIFPKFLLLCGVLTLLNYLFFLKSFLMWTSFKVFIECVIVLLLFYVLVFCLGGMWVFSPQPGIEPTPPCIGRGSLNPWTTGSSSEPLKKKKNFLFKNNYRLIKSCTEKSWIPISQLPSVLMAPIAIARYQNQDVDAKLVFHSGVDVSVATQCGSSCW